MPRKLIPNPKYHCQKCGARISSQFWRRWYVGKNPPHDCFKPVPNLELPSIDSVTIRLMDGVYLGPRKNSILYGIQTSVYGSSHVAAIKYEEGPRECWVKFSNGDIYVYKNVSEEEWHALENSTYKGRYVQIQLRRAHTARKELSGEESKESEVRGEA